MISEKMTQALNDQLNAELYSAYLYLSMAACGEDKNLSGFSHWMRMQAQEEHVHAMKFFNYLLERDAEVKLQPIDGPPTSWETPKDMFQQAYEHEQYVSDRINKLVDLAIEESDHATNNFLQWFVAEQVEEEASVNEVLQQIELMVDAPGGIFMLDRQLASRAAPSATESPNPNESA
jgi:ferritin